MLRLQNICKKFGNVEVLKNISFDINPGEVVGLVGENGAGKSTLMKIFYGIYQPSSGQLLKDGQNVCFNNPRDAAKNGIGMVFQEQSLIMNLSVGENIFLGYENEFLKMGCVQWKKLHKAARKQLELVGLDISPKMKTEDLSFAQRQMVELAKVLVLKERMDGDIIIMLDEPTSMLSQKEIDILFQIIRNLKDRASFIFVSHRLDEILEVSDRIVILRDGELIDIYNADEVTASDIHEKMVGRSINEFYYKEDKQLILNEDADILLKVHDISKKGSYENISFELHAGEVLTLIGSEGSGREAIIRSIFGLEKKQMGHIEILGQSISSYDAHKGVRHHLGYVPRERKTEGIVSMMNVAENISLPKMENISKWKYIDAKKEIKVATSWIEKLSIKVPSYHSLLENLSGGNQQKVVLARWREAQSQILLLDHPTRGLDVGAKEDVYNLVREVCAEGVGVILVADTLEEAIGLSHNIIVLKDGKITKKLRATIHRKPSQVDIISYMV